MSDPSPIAAAEAVVHHTAEALDRIIPAARSRWWIVLMIVSLLVGLPVALLAVIMMFSAEALGAVLFAVALLLIALPAWMLVEAHR